MFADLLGKKGLDQSCLATCRTPNQCILEGCKNSDDIDTCTVAYDDALTFDLSEMEAELCDKSPSGQCEYSMASNFTCCIHCGRESELQ